MTETIGVIGLGIMGGAIARNLARAGHRVIGFDLDAARVEALGDAGVTAAATASDLAAQAGIVLVCLPHVAALEATVATLTAAAPYVAPPVVAELSTLPLDAKLAARDALADAGIALLDCPLSGTGAQAVTGDLSVFASGDEIAWERCADAFAGFARVCHYLGPFGNGTKMKLVANLLVAIHNVAAAEAVLLGLRAGLDPASLVAVAGSGAGASRMLEMRGPMMVKGKFTPATMKLDVWKKDMALIADFAARCGAATPLFAATAPLYEQACAAGLGESDTAAVFTVLAAMSAKP
jgi:3-hydroxyisobutyrate dehydrogenase/glyoxylate/succinic semialdehyde reductase